MDFKKDISRFSPLVILAILAILIFFLLKPILTSILWGFILAYLFFPIYKKLNKWTKSRNISAFMVLLLTVLIILIPILLIIPPLISQAFESFRALQTINLHGILADILPTASEQFTVQIITALNSFISKLSSSALNYLANVLVNSMEFVIHIFVIGFVFFYSLRDGEKLKALAKDISPLSRAKEKLVITQFKDVTNSLIYGQVLVGLVQGVLAAIALFIVGVPNALLLAVFAVVISVIPIIGPSLIWIPVTIYLFMTNTIWVAILYLFYNLIIVSASDNILRSYIVSKRINLSSGIVFVGMMGGFLLFRILGLIIGPLLLSYFITFLQSYKEEAKFRLMKKEEDKLIEVAEKKIPFFKR